MSKDDESDAVIRVGVDGHGITAGGAVFIDTRAADAQEDAEIDIVRRIDGQSDRRVGINDGGEGLTRPVGGILKDQIRTLLDNEQVIGAVDRDARGEAQA